MLLEPLTCSVGLSKVAFTVPFNLRILKICKDFSPIGIDMIMPILLAEMKSVSMNIIQLFKRKMSYKLRTETNIGFSSNLLKNAQGYMWAQRRFNTELKSIGSFCLHYD